MAGSEIIKVYGAITLKTIGTKVTVGRIQLGKVSVYLNINS